MTPTYAALLGPALLAVALSAQAPYRQPAAIFAASCATCHGQDGLGGRPGWVDPTRTAPRLARGMGMTNLNLENRYQWTIRNGAHYQGGFRQAMPAFGRQVLSDPELDALVKWLIYAPPLGGSNILTGAPPPSPPAGNQIVLEILDEAPWFRDDGRDSRDPSGDRRRVVLSPGDYLKVINRGRTWHSITNLALGVDTGFLGHADHLPGQNAGYCYLTVADLAAGAHQYYCRLHPYMQVEIVTPGFDPMPLTHVRKLPLPPPAAKGVGEVWVGLQTRPNGANAPNGAVDIIDSTDWSRQLITNVGNNPHNGWAGRARDGSNRMRNVVVYANWHDVTLTVIDADSRQVLGAFPCGAANAHVMTAPGTSDPATGGDRWFATIMGSNKLQEFDPFQSLAAGGLTMPAISQSQGLLGQPAFSPHGLWFADSGSHILTANTFDDSASLWSLSRTWTDGGGRSGIGAEVASCPTGGVAPLASFLFQNPERPTAYVGFANNAATDDISLFAIDARLGAETMSRILVPAPWGNSAGNLKLRDTAANPVRWTHMPIQIAVSPEDATAHGRYLVVCNKASMNVNIVPLDKRGSPQGVYTFPGGLGGHGIAFGRKAPDRNGRRAYLAYVSNTFEDYVSAYDLETLEKLLRLDALGLAPPEFRAGGAQEAVLVEGHAAQAVLGVPRVVAPIIAFSPDARGLVHIGDIPLSAPAQAAPRCYLKTHVWVNLPGMGMTMLDLDLQTNTGAMGIFARPLPCPW